LIVGSLFLLRSRFQVRGTELAGIRFPHMNPPSEPTVWDLPAALSSDAFELRPVAPGEFELIDVTMERTDCSGPSLNGDPSAETAVGAET